MSDSEDDYGPIDTSWGLQTSNPTTPNESKGWDSLIDPNIKIGPNGLGGGDLHRKGRNFKPIDEEYILAQRLNKPIATKKALPKRDTDGPKGVKTKKKPENNGKHQPAKKQSSSTSTVRVPKPSNEKNGASKWLQSSLVDEPFWEKKKEVSKKPPPPSTPPETSLERREFGIRPKPKVESVWTKFAAEKELEQPLWGAVETDIKPFEDKGWGNYTIPENDWNKKPSNSSGWKSQSNAGWGEESISDWAPIEKNTKPTTIPTSKPSWLNSIPSQENNIRPPQQSRFSNPSKQRYSENAPADVPKPINYRSENTPIVLNTAPPPPPVNNILLTVVLELPDDLTVSVEVRELDDPNDLAEQVGKNNNIQTMGVIAAIAKFLSSQKSMALKKKQITLQRRAVSNRPKYPTTTTQTNAYTNNAYTNNAYTNNAFTNNAYTNSSFRRQATPSSPPPFTRKVYY